MVDYYGICCKFQISQIPHYIFQTLPEKELFENFFFSISQLYWILSSKIELQTILPTNIWDKKISFSVKQIAVELFVVPKLHLRPES